MMESILLKLNDGFTMMLIGMGTVLVFLCLMIVAMAIMSKCVAKLNERFPEVVPVPAGGKSGRAVKNDDSEIAAAIVAAMFRK